VSEPENFLSRWARLKREAAEAAETPDPAGPDVAADASRPAAPADEAQAGAKAPSAAAPAFDISTLPPIESITATTDIRAFLKPGVPPDLARAALRRAWVADPAIRDFIGIAENQWDFNDPNAIPGFGTLGPLDDVRRLVGQVFGAPLGRSEDAAAVAEKSSVAVGASSDSIPAELQDSAATEGDLCRPENAQQPTTLAAVEPGNEAPAAAQKDKAREPSSEPSSMPADSPPRRSHGGALPQ
jgi:Protein of unknown function (DUF3306)